LLALPWLLGLAGCFLEAIRYRPPPADNPGFKLPVKVEISPRECSQEQDVDTCKPTTTWVSKWHAGQLEVGVKGHRYDILVESVGELVIYEDRRTNVLLGIGSGALFGFIVPLVIILIAGAASN